MPEDLGPDETQILAAMLGISEMVGGLADLQELLATVVRIVPQLVRSNRCAIFIFDEDSGELRCQQAFGPDIDETRRLGKLVIKDSYIPRLTQKVLKQRLPALIRDAAKEDILPADIVQEFRIKALLVTPLVCRDKALGVMTLDDTKGNRFFTSKEINIVMGISTLTAIAIDSYTARDDLATERARLGAMAVALSDSFLVLDSHFRIKYANPLVEELLGWKAQEIVGRPCSEVFEAEDAHGVRVCGGACPGRGALWGDDVTGQVHRLYFQRKDGNRVLCDVRIAPVRDSRGRVTEIVYVLTRARTSSSQRVVSSSREESADELQPVILGNK